MKQILASFLFLFIVGSIVVPPVSAANNPLQRIFQRTENREEQREASKASENIMNRKEIRQETREESGTKSGLIKKLFRKRASIGAGTVTAIDGTTITITGKDGKTYTIQTDDKTQFRRRFWGKGALSEIKVGDIISVIGKWTDETETTVQAVLIRDLSIQKFMGVFFGTVDSLSASGWVMKTVNRGSQTVTVSSETKFINRTGEAITQADIAGGHKVRIRGLWDRTANTITEIKEVKDFSLPIKVTPTPTP